MAVEATGSSYFQFLAINNISIANAETNEAVATLAPFLMKT
jgi:hypothetical protein